MNSISITGRIAQELELKQTPNGINVCAFTVAVKRPRVKDTTDFIPCVAWRNSAEFVTHYFRKGDLIAITGALTTRKYEDKNGAKRTAFEVVCDTLDFCGVNTSAGSETKSEEPAQDKTPQEVKPQFEELGEQDDLPF